MFAGVNEQRYAIDEVWPSPNALKPKVNDMNYYQMEVEGVTLMYARGVDKDQ